MTPNLSQGFLKLDQAGCFQDLGLENPFQEGRFQDPGLETPAPSCQEGWFQDLALETPLQDGWFQDSGLETSVGFREKIRDTLYVGQVACLYRPPSIGSA